MDAKERKDLVKSILKSVQEKIVPEIDKMPSSWDGFEIRWYLSDAFAHEARFGTTNQKRRSAYRNDKMVGNLFY